MNYYYHDNWMGIKHEFKTLTEARMCARREAGEGIKIYNWKGCFTQFVQARGFTSA